MANGDECIRCGLQETEHKFPEYAPKGVEPCGNFESPIKHHPDCPVLDCNGNCEETLKDQAWAAKVAENRVRNSWYIDSQSGRIVMLDMRT